MLILNPEGEVTSEKKTMLSRLDGQLPARVALSMIVVIGIII